MIELPKMEIPKAAAPSLAATTVLNSPLAAASQPAAAPLTVADLARARREHSDSRFGAAILIYGDPRTGKTLLAGTIAKLPHIKRVYYFDLEKGIETLVYAKGADGKPYFTDEELAKIIHINIIDTASSPAAAVTILKAFTSPTPIRICQAHGVVDCKEPNCNAQSIMFNLRGCGIDDAVVIDSGSQLADSVLAMEKVLYSYKDLRKYYGEFTNDMSKITSAIQAANTTVIMVTHATEIFTGDEKAPVYVGTFPNCGSQNFSRKLARSFGYIIYKSIEMNKFKAGSGEMYKPKILTGTRTGVAIESIDNATLVDLLNPIC